MKDHAKIIQQFFEPLTDQEALHLSGYFQEEALTKNDYLTKEGKTCEKFCIIQSGILRVYATVDDREITQWISIENSLMTDVSSFFFDQPGRWSIQALTDTKLLTITKKNYNRLCQDFPKWIEIEKKFILMCFAMVEDRVFTHLSMTAEERYHLYFQHNKKLFNQVPLQYIASVLGMSPETFSRVRKRNP